MLSVGGGGPPKAVEGADERFGFSVEASASAQPRSAAASSTMLRMVPLLRFAMEDKSV